MCDSLEINFICLAFATKHKTRNQRQPLGGVKNTRKLSPVRFTTRKKVRVSSFQKKSENDNLSLKIMQMFWT